MKKYLVILALLPVLAFAQSGDSTFNPPGSNNQIIPVPVPVAPTPFVLPRPTINLGPPQWFSTGCGYGGACQCPDGWLMVGTSGWWATYTRAAYLCRQIL